MKMQRTQYPRVLVSAGVLFLVGAFALWRWVGPLANPEATAPPAAEKRRETVTQPLARTDGRLRSMPPREIAISPTAKPNDEPSRQCAAPLISSSPLFLRDFAAALTAILNEPDLELREEQVEHLAGKIALSDLPAAVEFSLSPDSEETSRDVGRRLFQRWTEHAPCTAATWVSQSAGASIPQDIIAAVASAWVNQDRTAALEWAQSLPTEAQRQGALVTIGYETARTEPIEALNLANVLPPGPAQDNLVTHAANQWAANAPEEAAAWAKGIPDDALRERTLSVIATAWGETSPRAAATLAMQSLIPGRQQDDAVVGIVQRWVQKDPEQAAAWVAAFPGRAVRDAAVENLVRLWADQDMEQAEQWLTSLEVGEMRDVAIGTYVSKLVLQEPDAASRWVEKIEDQFIREREMIAVGEAWMGHDEAAARSWILHSSLPDTAKERLFALSAD